MPSCKLTRAHMRTVAHTHHLSQEYSLLHYWMVLTTLGPLMYNFVYGYLTSVASGEWAEMGDMSREAWIATKGLVLTSPFLAYAFKVRVGVHWRACKW